MDNGEVRTFLFGAVIGLIAMGILWSLSTWRRRRNATPPVVIQQIQLPIENQTPLLQPVDTDEDQLAPFPSDQNGTTSDPVDELARYRRRVKSLSLKLERTQTENAELTSRWNESRNQLFEAETGLGRARTEIEEIRGIVLELGATKTEQEVIDLR